MARRPLLAGNWKMHLTIAEAQNLATAVAKSASDVSDRDVMIAPPFTSLAPIAEQLSGSNLILAGQNVCWEEQGAFTGEISPAMLRDASCRMAIIGHSERRHIFGEDNILVNKRVKGCLLHGITPILCIGETLQEREDENTFAVLEEQVRESLSEVAINDPDSLVVAYEPVWAIGTGKTASPEQVQEVHAFLRGLLENIFEKNIASNIRILYGGSVNSGNVDDLMALVDVDGALVGGAALQPDSFDRIIHFR